jgi:hypothetical protein
LAPAMHPELVMGFMAGEMRIAYEPQVSLIAGFGKGLGKAGYATGNASDPRIIVGTLKRQDMKLHAYPLLSTGDDQPPSKRAILISLSACMATIKNLYSGANQRNSLSRAGIEGAHLSVFVLRCDGGRMAD